MLATNVRSRRVGLFTQVSWRPMRTDRVGAAALVLVCVLALPSSRLAFAAEEDQTSGVPAEKDSAAQSNQWHLNTVLSTSLETPGAAIRIPIDETVEVRGTVFDTDGAPAVGAEVWAASLFAEPPLRERVLTNRRGQFLLHLKPLTGKSERWSLIAIKDNKGTDIKGDLDWMKNSNGIQPASLTAQLVERGMTRCLVLAEETRRPIPNARLFLGDGRVFVSNAKGQIEIGGLPQGIQRAVVLADRRYRRRVVFDNTLNLDRNLNIYLPKAGRIVGTVVDQNGQPVPHAWIKVYGSGRALALDGRCSVADDKGKFIWEGVLTDRVLRAIHAGHAGYETDELRHITVSKEAPLEVRFRLSKLRDPVIGIGDLNVGQLLGGSQQAKKTVLLARRTVEGRVIGPDGAAVSGAKVRWGATDYEEVHRETKTDQKGQFQLPQVPDRVGYITVMNKSFAHQFVKVSSGQTQIEVKLKEGQSIGGQIISQSGRPIAGTYVVPVIASPDPSLCNPLWISSRATYSDANGRFEITGLPQQAQFDFLHKQMSELRSQPLEIGRLDHVVKLNSRGGFRGRIVDSDGKPVKDFRVMIDFPREKRVGDKVASGFSVVLQRIGVSYTDDEGRFYWGDEIAPHATYRVTVASDGYGNAVNDRVISTTVDQLAESQEYVFEMQAPHSMSVHVLSDTSAVGEQPIEGARVTLVERGVHLDQGPFSWGSNEIGGVFATTDAEGVASFEDLPSREGTLVIQANGFERQRIGWRNGETSFRVKLREEAAIGGAVRSSEGDRMQGLVVTLNSADGQRNWQTLEDNDFGRFLFRNLPAGVYTLTLLEERRTLHQEEFAISASQRLYLGITVDSASGSATVVDETPSDGTPSR